MATRVGPITIDSKTIAATGTPEAITADDITCTSVYLVAAEANTGANVYLVDSNDDAKKTRIPSGGLTVPISDPKFVKVTVDTNGDKVEWAAM